MENRKPEQVDKIQFRSDRFYNENNEWFFCIRRGPDQGPYLNRELAVTALKDFVSDQQDLESKLRAERELLYNNKFGLNSYMI